MPADPLRVVVWSTGGIGSIAIRAVHRRADLDLVGVWVHSPDKVGRDAGELAGGEPIGVAATDDVDALLGLHPDCVVYAASGPEQDAAAVPDYVRFLAAGINVVTVSSWALIHPPSYEPTWRAQLEEAAGRGGASLYASGIEPGFAADQLPLLLMTQSNTIRSIRASEFALYDTYPVEFMMKDVMGFGQSLDHEAVAGDARERSSRRGVRSSGSSPTRSTSRSRRSASRSTGWRRTAPSRSRAAPSRPAPAERSARRPSVS